MGAPWRSLAEAAAVAVSGDVLRLAGGLYDGIDNRGIELAVNITLTGPPPSPLCPDSVFTALAEALVARAPNRPVALAVPPSGQFHGSWAEPGDGSAPAFASRHLEFPPSGAEIPLPSVTDVMAAVGIDASCVPILDGGGVTRVLAFSLDSTSSDPQSSWVHVGLHRLVISDGSAESRGGALYIGKATVADLTDVVLYNSTAGNLGGGAYIGSRVGTVRGLSAVWCTAERGGGLGIGFMGRPVVLSQLLVAYNAAATVGGGLFSVCTTLQLEDATLIGNLATVGGGMFANQAHTYPFEVAVAVLDSRFERNIARLAGGGLVVSDEAAHDSASTASLLRVVFVNNRVEGPMSEDEEAEMNGMAILGLDTNFVGGGALFGLSVSHLDVSASTFESNSATSHTSSIAFGGAVVLKSTQGARFSSVELASNSVRGGTFCRQGGSFSLHNSVVVFTNVTVTNSLADPIHARMTSSEHEYPGVSWGGALYAQSSDVSISASVFVDNTARGWSVTAAGALFIDLKTRLVLTDSRLERNSVVSYQTGFAEHESLLRSDPELSPTKVYKAALVQMMKATKDHGLCTGGAIHARGDANLDISRCVLSGNAALTSGGAIDALLTRRIVLTDVTMEHNRALAGGAVALSSSTISLTSCLLKQNTAWLRGGGMYGDASSHITVTTSRIETNGAAFGGAIHALPPGSVHISGNTLQLGNEPVFCEPYGIEPVGVLPDTATPSSYLHPRPTFRIVDLLGRTVAHDDETSLVIIPRESMSGTGALSRSSSVFLANNIAAATSGVAHFSDVTIEGRVGSVAELVAVAPELETRTAFFFDVNLTSCLPGFHHVGSSECQACPSGSYNLDGGECKPCPAHAQCLGGNTLVTPIPGWWRASPSSVSMFRCFPGACAGGDSCADDRVPSSRLCGTCIDTFSHFGNLCTKCLFSPVVSASVAALSCVAFAVFSTALRGSRSPALVVCVHTFQVMHIMMLDTQAFDNSRFFSLLSYPRLAACIGVGDYYRTFVARVIFMSMPVLLAPLLYGVARGLQRVTSWRWLASFVHWRYFVFGCANMLLLLYIPLVDGGLSHFSCREVGSVWLLNSNVSVECFTDLWWRYATVAGILALFVGIGWPVLMLWLIYQTTILDKTPSSAYAWLRRPPSEATLGLSLRNAFGVFFSRDFETPFRLWLVVWLAQKLVLVIISVSLRHADLAVTRSFVLCLVSLGMLLVQTLLTPWRTTRTNAMVLFSLGAQTVGAIFALAASAVEADTLYALFVSVIVLVFLVVGVLVALRLAVVLRSRPSIRDTTLNPHGVSHLPDRSVGEATASAGGINAGAELSDGGAKHVAISFSASAMFDSSLGLPNLGVSGPLSQAAVQTNPALIASQSARVIPSQQPPDGGSGSFASYSGSPSAAAGGGSMLLDSGPGIHLAPVPEVPLHSSLGPCSTSSIQFGSLNDLFTYARRAAAADEPTRSAAVALLQATAADAPVPLADLAVFADSRAAADAALSASNVLHEAALTVPASGSAGLITSDSSERLDDSSSNAVSTVWQVARYVLAANNPSAA
ncbi:uncharacterized protein AMSG_04455 [Thecamonas trahens ATCC 50062]|uniref:Right handed beta helix domain-containing protein n=1 Tax=Thecamonas trahens ATCC 50062 TaxID=461836 RepID=A0A0L0D7P3_THETB|nr:hypothetical protein AMSG_04455 [Thecamonas trahens ATCC 50062]KNC48225.1 hypothetical protein AMSG_04455 [Thecamonas trahens ATCC 50062]|eukprot:XP_013758794.1 hypothetical protein AMSG_04455 [Thecamonas trahens ATCC 50062]